MREKPTVTRLINGLIPEYYEGTLEGSVLIDGEDIRKVPMYETAKKVRISISKSAQSVFST